MDDFTTDDAFLESLRADRPVEDLSTKLGQVVAGSLSQGLEVRLDRDQALEDLAVGRYTVIRAGGRIFFGMITDIALDSANPAFEKNPPEMGNEFVRQVYLGTSIFGRIHVSPMLVLDEDELDPAAGQDDSRPFRAGQHRQRRRSRLRVRGGGRRSGSG